MRVTRAQFQAVAALALALAGCGVHPTARPDADGRPHVMVTISTLASFARAIGGDRVVVETLVPVGASPEDYQPTPQDVARLHDASLLVENGLGLESWLDRTVAGARNPALRVVVCTDGLPAIEGNPHLWMDPELARRYAAAVARALAASDPRDGAYFARNARAQDRRLVALAREIRTRITTVPPASRTMIVFHDAWTYYDRRFGLRTVGVLESAPGRDPSPATLGRLVDLARANHVRAVFAEPEYDPRLLRALARSAGIRTVETLYDDSVGADPRVRDYESMLRYDTEIVVRALGGAAR